MDCLLDWYLAFDPWVLTLDCVMDPASGSPSGFSIWLLCFDPDTGPAFPWQSNHEGRLPTSLSFTPILMRVYIVQLAAQPLSPFPAPQCCLFWVW